MDERRPVEEQQPHFDPGTVEAVVFDIGGVFLYPHYDSVEAVLDHIGVARPGEVHSYRRAHHAGAAALSSLDRPTEESSQQFWTAYDHAYAASLGVEAAHWDTFRERMIRREWDWSHADNIAAFHALHATGMPLAIVSNNTGAAPQQMIDHGICWVNDRHDLPRVAAIIDSALVGVSKPDPAIMRPALHALGIPADRVLYVGDTVHTDVKGATAAGMQVVQLDPFDHHTEYAHTRLHDLAEVNQMLGV